MPEFLNPFPGLVPRKMTKSELVRALRLNLAAELEAVHLYTSHAEAADDPLTKKMLLDVADEERVHAGEFLELIRRLAPEEQQLLDEGSREVEAMAAGMAAEQPAAAAAMPDLTTTVGSLRETPKEGE
jgi:rubrerythrin